MNKNTMSLFIIFFFVSHLYLVSYTQAISVPISKPIPKPKTVFLLAGQGNMVGRGGVTESQGRDIWDKFVPSECQPDPSILRLDANLNWVEAREPLHIDIYVAPNRTTGIGPGMSFAHAILKMKPSLIPIGLVPSASGSSKINDWQRGTELYNKLMNRAIAAVKNNGAKFGGLLWWQGGGDSMKQEDAIMFRVKTIKFFNDLRVDLKSPRLPIIQVAVAKNATSFSHLVNAAQLSMQLPNLKTIDSPQLPVEANKVDFTSESQVIIGKRLAEEYMKLKPSSIFDLIF